MSAAVCWITDYYLKECKLRACVHSPDPLHPCTFNDEDNNENDC
jgi:hypothetical protein